jgi:hypothetical protein
MEVQPTRSRLSFSIRTVLEIIAIVALVLALLYGRFEEVTACNGRYELYRRDPEGPSSRELIFLLDTKTGKLWSAEVWRTMGAAPTWISSEPAELSGKATLAPASATPTGPPITP